ncbi:MAG TPA: patatin-like phospholipase family protein [Steroidobacteraceae bacterium]|nr:patatin-like phospholipase family protein [Steroidobacteraceae bacterium]
MHLAKTVALAALLLLSVSAGAQEPASESAVPPAAANPGRPRIGLVLSGGGARGAAHIGVLKMLDRLHVPVDVIAGTSMGAVVGGLYASGMTGVEIEHAMAALNWQAAFRDRPPRTQLDYRRKEEDRQFLVNLPLGLQGRRLVIPKGLLQGQLLTETLRKMTLPVARITDFDQLPTPFRAVATNLETGAKVVLGSGDLTTAMRASMSVPGVFAPVEDHNQILVDGGLADNLPIDVARAMGVDVLIVVDAGFPLQPAKNLNSLPSITNQMLAILLRRNIERDLAMLSPKDIVVTLQLGDFSSYDFPDTMKIVNAGETAVWSAEPRLSALEVSAEEYQRYLLARRSVRDGLPRIDYVKVQPDSKTYQRQIDDLFGQFVGQTLDPAALEQQVKALYGRGNLEMLDYQLDHDPFGHYGLDFSARRNSWGPNYLRFGVQLEDDFRGLTTFNAAGRLDITELNSLGAESVWDAQVGSAPLLATELYLPLSNVYRYFAAPHLQVEAHDIAQVEDGRQVGLFRTSSFDYGIDFGREFSSWGEVRLGVLQSNGNTHVSLGDFSVKATHFDVTEGFVRLGYDTLDSANFPHSGQALVAQVSIEGGAQGTDLFTVDWRAAHSWARNTVVAWLTAGSTVGGSQTNVRTFFPLGGFLNLSGVQTGTLAGPQYAIGRLIYLRKVGNGGEGILDVPAYVGTSFEIGNVWPDRRQISLSDTRQDFSIFFGADTYVGPAYFAIGYDASGSTSFFLFLGRSF